MGEIAQGEANLAQLAVQGNYRALTAQDMGESIREIYLNNKFCLKFRPKIF